MQKNKRNQVPMILFVLLLFAVAAVTLYQPQKVKAAKKNLSSDLMRNFRHMAILMKMASMSDLTLILPKKFVTAMAGNW